MPDAPLLRATDIAKSYAGVRALRGVSFELRAGEVHALVGENGAGKSTFIRILTGAVQPDAGEILLDGEPMVHTSPRAAKERGIAAIYQQPALFPELSVAENIAIGYEPGGLWGRVDWRRRRARALELLARVGARIDPDGYWYISGRSDDTIKVAGSGTDGGTGSGSHHGSRVGLVAGSAEGRSGGICEQNQPADAAHRPLKRALAAVVFSELWAFYISYLR